MKFQLTRPDGPWDYPTYGFRAVSGAILDGTNFSPAITEPPDVFWTVYTGGSAQTGITLIPGANGTAPPPAPTADGNILTYRRSSGGYQPATPAEWFALPEVSSAVASSGSASFLPRWKASTVYAIGDVVVAPNGEVVTAKTNHTSGTTYSAANWSSAVTASGTQTRTDLDGLYAPATAAAPVGTPTRSVAHTMVSAVQTGHGWAFSGGGYNSGTSNLNDTSDFALGSQSIKVGTLGTGAAAFVSKSGLTAIDMTDKGFLLWVKIEDYNKLAFIVLDGGTDTSNYFRGTIFVGTDGLKNPVQSGEWVALTVPWATMRGTIVGAPNRASVTFVRVGFTDKSGSATWGRVGGIATYADTKQTTYPNGVVSLTFDDTYVSAWTVALAKMSPLSMRGTLYPICDRLDTAGYLSSTQLLTMQNLNLWEIGGHASSNAAHIDWTTGTVADFITELRAQRAWQLAHSLRVTSFAWPQGPFTPALVDEAAKYYSNAATTGSRFSSMRPVNPFRLGRLPLSSPTTLASAQGWIDTVKSTKGWAILGIHDLVTSGAGATSWLQSDFNTLVDYINTQGVAVAPVSEVLAAVS